MNTHSAPSRPTKFFYGWYIVLACSGLTALLSTLTFYSFGLYFNPLRDTFGWTATQIGLAYSFNRAQGGVVQPLTGFLIDRWGPRAMVLAGLLLVGTGFILMSHMTELWHFYLSFLVVAVGNSIGFNAPFNAAIVRWFRRFRSRATGTVWLGSTVGALFVPIIAFLIFDLGWRQAMMISGIGIWVLGIPLALLIRDRPEPYGNFPDGDRPIQQKTNREVSAGPIASTVGVSVKEAIKTRTFWILAVGISVENLLVLGITVHQVAYLTQSGFTDASAAAVLTAIGFAFLLGRVPYTIFGDRWDKRRVLIAMFAVNAVGVTAFGFAQQIWTVGIFVGMLGLAHGVLTPMRPTLIADYFGTRKFASIAGIFEIPSVMAGFLGPLVMGLSFDYLGEYNPAIWVFGGLFALMIPFFLLLRQPSFSAKSLSPTTPERRLI